MKSGNKEFSLKATLSFLLIVVVLISGGFIISTLNRGPHPSQPFSVINGKVYSDFTQCVIQVGNNHCKTSDGTYWSIYTKSDTNKSEPTEFRSVKNIYYLNISDGYRRTIKQLTVKLNNENGITYSPNDTTFIPSIVPPFTVYDNPNDIKNNLATKYYTLLSAMPQPMVTLYFSHSCTQITIVQGIWGTFVASNNETYTWPNVSHTYTINCHIYFSYWTPAGQK